MRLISCHIENFGRLSNENIDFSDGLNIFLKENGWGKSTLAAFLRVMLFGFENDKARSELENERKRYKPWAGGTPYGGSLTFMDGDGDIFVASRVFGAKQAEDIFELRNLETNGLSDKYSSNIGQELFDIDSDSFANTVFISQKSCESVANAMITAKIGGVEHDQGDLSRFEAAVKKLQEEENLRTPKRATGSVKRLNNDITELQARIAYSASVDDEIAQDEAEISGLSSAEHELAVKREELLARSREISKQKDAAEIKAKYDAVKGNVAACENAATEARSKLPASIPARAEIDGALLSLKKEAELKTRAESFDLTLEEQEAFSKLELMFAERLPEAEEIADNRSKWAEYTRRVAEVEKQEATVEAKKEALELRSNNNRGGFKVGLMIPGLIFALVGLFMIFAGAAGISIGFVNGIEVATGVQATVLALIIGVLLVIVGLIFIIPAVINKDKKAEIAELESAKKALADKSQEIARQKDMAMSIYDDVMGYLAEFKCEPADGDAIAALYGLEDGVRHLQHISDKKDNSEEALAEAARLHEKVENYLLGIGSFPGDNLEEQLQEIKDKMSAYDRAMELLNNAKSELERFERTTDLSALTYIPDEEEMASLEAVALEIDEVDKKLREVKDRLDFVKNHLQAASERYERRAEDEATLENMIAARDKAQCEYDLLVKTRSLLTEAKEAFTAEYLGPIRASFGKYYKMLSHDNSEPFRIDSALRLTVQAEGMQHDAGLFSEGNKDLLGLCYRMALADAMYPEDKPFILMDDPFTNLDADRLAGGMDFLDALKDQYQIIYMTCHDVRA